MTTTTWEDRAVCRRMVTTRQITSPDNDVFFNPALLDQGVAYCQQCPVMAECKIAAATIPHKEGVWHGKIFSPPTFIPDRGPYKTSQPKRLERYEQKLTDREIATAEKVSVSAIRKWRTTLGLPPQPSTVVRPVRDRSVKQMKEHNARFAAYNSGATDKEMAAKFGVTRAVVNNWRWRNGRLPANPDPDNPVRWR